MSTRVRQLRGRKKPTFASRLRMFWIFIVVALALVGYGLYALATLPQLRVHDVTVHGAGDVVSESEVLSAAHIDRSANAWLLNGGAIEKRIEAIPYVNAAHISRIPPADVTIEITLRAPVACLSSRTRIVTIDDAPRVLQDGCVAASLGRIDLPDIALGPPGTQATDPSLAGLLADSRVLAQAHVDVQSVSRDQFGGLVARDRTGVELLFGADTDLAQKAALVAPVRASIAKERPVRAIDLRAPGTPVVDFKP
jgi:hypothetical protein